MAVTVALLPSPLLGPAEWAGVGALLSERGRRVAAMPAFRGVRSYRDVLDAWEQALPANSEYVLVPHSNSGLYVPALGERRRVVGQIFVDAGIPPAAGAVRLAEPPLYRMLDALADTDGLLPPWTEWWAEDQLESLFPDASTRARVEREQSRLPLSYFAGRMPVAAGWTDRPSAYLAFGDTYDRERTRAVASGWPVRTLAGGHLLMLTEPAVVASALEDLMDAIGVPA